MLLAISAFQIYSKLAAASIFLPFIIIVLSKKKYEYPLTFLKYLIFFTALVEVIVETLWWHSVNNLPLLHLYIIVEFALLGWMYHLYLYKLLGRYLIPLIIVAFCTFSIINSLFIQSIFTFNTYARAIENLLLILLSLAYFYKMLKELKVKYLEKDPMFWINSGILVYFSGNLFIFIFSNYILPHKSLNMLFWSIHATLNLFIYTFYAIGLWLSRQNSE